MTDTTVHFDPRPLPVGPGPASEADRIADFSKVMRFLGAVLVVASASTFMLQRWSDGDEAVRYLTLLAMTGGLTAAGIFCALGVKENRGARTLLGLVLTTVPVHFAVMGGLLQSQFPWDGWGTGGAPWNAPSATVALLLCGLGLGVVGVLTSLSMRVMVRSHSSRLTLALFLAHAPVMLPLRNPDVIAWVLVGMLAALLLTEQRLSSLGYAMRTPEGRFVRLLMAVPVAIVAGRTAMWYDPGVMFLGVSLLGSGLFGFRFCARAFSDQGRAETFQSLLALVALLGWFLIASEAVGSGQVPESIEALTFALPAAGLLLLMSVTGVGSGHHFQSIAAVAAVGTAMTNLVMFWNAHALSVAGLACLGVGIASLASGIYARRKLPTALGIAGTVMALVQLIVAAVEFAHLAHWGSLAAIGVGLIFIAALFDRHAMRVLALARSLHEKQSDWAL